MGKILCVTLLVPNSDHHIPFSLSFSSFLPHSNEQEKELAVGYLEGH